MRNIFSRGYFDFLKNIIADLSYYPEMYRLLIWGHSWEIEKFSLWGDLDDFFKWLSIDYSSSLRDYSEILRSDNLSDIQSVFNNDR
ncbi:MAG: hypothetical protein IPH69_06575 [Bacteroidales bacterium]|nr:hypothetical protein [Bacteroidales bacterium]